MRLLRDLCEQGRTIVLVTHATENIGLCDLVAFLADGRLVYYGPPAEAPAVFQHRWLPRHLHRSWRMPGSLSAKSCDSAPRPFTAPYVLERQAATTLPALPDPAHAPPAQSAPDPIGSYAAVAHPQRALR